MPSRPVDAPKRTTTLPTPAAAERIMRRVSARPSAIALTRQFCSYGRLEVDLAADRRHADRVAVVPDAGHGVVEQVARAPRRVGLAEAQRVEHRDRPRAEREDVAQDAADAGGGALEGLDRAGVVVRLDLEGDRQPAAHRHRAGVLARPHDDVAALGGQRLEQQLGVLVGAVLAPQQREHRELDLVGRAPELVDDERVLVAREAEGDGVVDRGQDRPSQAWATAAAEAKSFSPSALPPHSSSTACSGWGMRPMTLPASLHTPAMSRAEPLGFSPGA